VRSAISLIVTATIPLGLYAAYVKLSSLLLRYTVRWTTSVGFAVIVCLTALFFHILIIGQFVPVGETEHGIIVFAAALFVGAWFLSTRSMDASGQLLGFKRALGLSGLTVGLMLATGAGLVLLSPILFHWRTSAP